MISHISIRDFAIIDRLELDVQDGLNIITGETGAGKSIIIEAVSLALGSRADTAFVRTGKERAVIQLVVDRPLDHDENTDTAAQQMILTREIYASGKSICKVDDTIVTVSHLNRLCKKIADIHGQYDHQSLLNPDSHIQLIDSYREKDISPAKKTVATLFNEYSSARRELSALLSGQAEAERRRDFMRFELDEITSAAPVVGEDTALAEQLMLLQNSEKIYSNLSETYDLLYGEENPSSISVLGKGQHLLGDIAAYSSEISGFSDVLSDAYYKLEDLSVEIRRYKDSLTFSPEEIDDTVSRIELLNSLKRKFGGTIESVLSYGEEIREELGKIEHIDERKAELICLTDQYRAQLQTASQTLSSLRKKVAEEIEHKINQELAALNFQNAVLTIAFAQPSQDADAETSFTENGIDQLEFLITTNKGEQAKPLAKIASGGEISRIMLAFKRIIGDYDRTPTMIFDEIDSGISGVTASIVGQKLREIAGSHQVICITHLPQIAAYGSHHYKIEKTTVGEGVHTTVVPLDDREKVAEIARLLGGINITETTLKSAEELLKLSR